MGTDLFGRDFHINYTHTFVHLKFFMRSNITLKMVEQQAVELYMKLLKSIWNNQTNHRGWEQQAGAALGVGGAADGATRLLEKLLARYSRWKAKLFEAPAARSGLSALS